MIHRSIVVLLVLFLSACQTEGGQSHLSESWNRVEAPVTMGDTSADMGTLALSEVFVDSVFTMKGRLVYLQVGALETTPVVEGATASQDGMDEVIGFTYAIGESRNESIVLRADDFDGMDALHDESMIDDAWIHNIYANDMSIVASVCNSESTECRQLEVLIDVHSGRYKVYPLDG